MLLKCMKVDVFSFPDILYTVAICHSLNCSKNKDEFFLRVERNVFCVLLLSLISAHSLLAIQKRQFSAVYLKYFVPLFRGNGRVPMGQ